jgi:hypothetical protein
LPTRPALLLRRVLQLSSLLLLLLQWLKLLQVVFRR